jgi:hypothetical protein
MINVGLRNFGRRIHISKRKITLAISKRLIEEERFKTITISAFETRSFDISIKKLAHQLGDLDEPQATLKMKRWHFPNEQMDTLIHQEDILLVHLILMVHLCLQSQTATFARRFVSTVILREELAEAVDYFGSVPSQLPVIQPCQK